MSKNSPEKSPSCDHQLLEERTFWGGIIHWPTRRSPSIHDICFSWELRPNYPEIALVPIECLFWMRKFLVEQFWLDGHHSQISKFVIGLLFCASQPAASKLVRSNFFMAAGKALPSASCRHMLASLQGVQNMFCLCWQQIYQCKKNRKVGFCKLFIDEITSPSKIQFEDYVINWLRFSCWQIFALPCVKPDKKKKLKWK